MTDVHSPEVRSYNMSQIKGKNTKPEMIVRKFLFANGFRYRLHDKKLPGKPDIVLSKHKTVIFINGCFFHGHEGCRYFILPKSNTVWWSDKINGNKLRDSQNIEKLNAENWNVITVFECGLKKNTIDSTLYNLILKIKELSA
jgi:DNA mismatch endonuclease (patch repair protein)